MTVFARVAEIGSFSRAAEALDLANASVTTCVRNLEKDLGVTLLHRDTRRLRLTEEGEAYLGHVRGILAAVEAATTDVQSRLGSLTGRLVVETPISFGHAILCPALPAFAARYPGIATAVTLTNQPHHLIERAIDVAIRMDRVEDAELVARPIYEARYVLCCAPALAATLPASPRDLDPKLCLGVLPEERPVPNAWQLGEGGGDGDGPLTIRPEGTLHFNSSDALIVAAQAGAGVIHVLDIFTRRAIAEGRLVAVYPDWATRSKTFFAVTTRARLASAKVRVFNEFLSEVIEAERRPSGLQPVAVKSIGRR